MLSLSVLFKVRTSDSVVSNSSVLPFLSPCSPLCFFSGVFFNKWSPHLDYVGTEPVAREYALKSVFRQKHHEAKGCWRLCTVEES